MSASGKKKRTANVTTFRWHSRESRRRYRNGVQWGQQRGQRKTISNAAINKTGDNASEHARAQWCSRLATNGDGQRHDAPRTRELYRQIRDGRVPIRANGLMKLSPALRTERRLDEKKVCNLGIGS